MKRKKIAKIIGEAAEFLDHFKGAAAIDTDGKHDPIDDLITADEMHAIQAALIVTKHIIIGDLNDCESGTDVVANIVSLYGFTKLEDILGICPEGDEGEEDVHSTHTPEEEQDNPDD